MYKHYNVVYKSYLELLRGLDDEVNSGSVVVNIQSYEIKSGGAYPRLSAAWDVIYRKQVYG